MGTKKERSTEAALHPLSAVLRKPNNEDIVIPQSHAIRERATMIHLALLIEISQVSLNKTKHNASRFFPAMSLKSGTPGAPRGTPCVNMLHEDGSNRLRCKGTIKF